MGQAVKRRRRPVTLTKEKAARMLAEAAAGRRRLSRSQHALFEMVAHGKKPTRLQNPRMIEIAPRVDAILYSFKDQPHGDCDKECKDSDHRYQHDFEKDFPLMWDTATGRLVI